LSLVLVLLLGYYCYIVRECRVAEGGDGACIHVFTDSGRAGIIPTRRLPFKRRQIRTATVRIWLSTRLVLHQRLDARQSSFNIRHPY